MNLFVHSLVRRDAQAVCQALTETYLKKHLLQKLFATEKKWATDCFVDLTLLGMRKYSFVSITKKRTQTQKGYSLN
jgi:hypothetical protein